MNVREAGLIFLAVFAGLYATGNRPLVVMASALAGGIVIHEGAHYVVARLAGRQPWISTATPGRPIEVVWTTDALRLGDGLALAAPILLGLVLGPCAVVTGYTPGWAVAGWILLFSGSRDDWEGLIITAASIRGHDTANPPDDVPDSR